MDGYKYRKTEKGLFIHQVEEENLELHDHECNYAEGKKHQMAFGWSVLNSRGLVNEKDKEQFISHFEFLETGVAELITKFVDDQKNKYKVEVSKYSSLLKE